MGNNRIGMRFILAALLVAMVAYVQHKEIVSTETGYSKSEIERVNTIVQQSRPLLQRQADAYAEIYGLGEDDINNEVVLWRK